MFHAPEYRRGSLATDVWPDLDAVKATWTQGSVFEPKMEASRRASMIDGWKLALRRALLT